MKLDNFKELLIKKSGDNKNLELLIKYMKDEYLLDHVVESLEKMAWSNSKKNPNAAVKHLATNMNNFKAGMIHDALSHHASHYKAALKAGDKQTADSHMRKIFKTMHIIDKATRDGLNDHTQGRLKVEAIDPKPWERNNYQTTKGDSTKYSTDTRGWSRHKDSQTYDYLRMAPHADKGYQGDGLGAAEVKTHGHNKAYPLEEIKVNGKYLHIEDVEHSGEHTEHPFDSHPIYGHYNHAPKNYGADKKAQYLDERDSFHGDEQGGKAKYREKLSAMSKEDFANRGMNKPDPIHDDIEGLDLGGKSSAPSAGESSSMEEYRDNWKQALEEHNKKWKKND